MTTTADNYWIIDPDSDTYTDWEGFSGTPELKYAIDHIRTLNTPDELDPKVCDLTLHWVQSNIDEGGYTPTPDEIADTYWTIEMVLNGGRFMKSGIDWADPTNYGGQ